MSAVSARAMAALLAAALPFVAASPVASAGRSADTPAGAPAFAPPFAIQAPPSFGFGDSNGTEPRLAVDGAKVYVIASPSPDDGHAVVWRSADGGASFRRAAAELPGQMAPSTDVDIVRTATHRLVAIEEDAQTSQMLVTGYSDDGGSTWKLARLESSSGPYRWVRWSYQWPASPGDYSLMSRATDSQGNQQPLERDKARKDAYELNWCAPLTCSVR